MVESMASGARQPAILLGLLLITCMTADELLNHSVSQFPLL